MAVKLSCEDEVRERLVPVILGADILGYTYVRSFHDAYGLTSIVLATADVKATSRSRFCDYRIVDGIETDEGLLSHLAELGSQLAAEGKLGMLVGSGDWFARLLSRHKEELSAWYVVPYIDFDLLDQLTQKEFFYNLCEELDIPYPRTWTFDCSDADASIPVDEFTYPLIAKPSNSAEYHYAEFPGKKKIYEVATPEELSRIFAQLQASCYDRELIIQEFIPGGDDGLRSISIYTDKHGKPLMTCSGQVVLQDHAPLAIGNPVLILSERVEKPIEDACRMLEYVGYHGFANFDVKLDPRDGTYRFFEVNTRPGRNSFYTTLGGVDFVRLMVQDYVLDMDLERRDATEEFAYACVPPIVVKKTVEDPALRERALRMYKTGRASFPLYNDRDCAAQRFWARLTYYNQVLKFKKYVWDTDGKQIPFE